MAVLFLLVSCLTAVIAVPTPSTPATVTNETMKQLLINPSPKLMAELKKLSETLKTTKSFAATSPDKVALGPQLSNLSLMSGLTGLVKQILTRILTGRQPETPTQPAPSTPTGNDIFTQTGGGGVIMHQPPVVQPMPYDPFGFMFPGGGSPFNMFYPGMMFNMMDGIFEGIF